MSSASYVFGQAWKAAQYSNPSKHIVDKLAGPNGDVKYAASLLNLDAGKMVAINLDGKSQVIAVGTRFGTVILRSVERPGMETFYQVFHPEKAIFEMTLTSRNRIASTVQIAIVVGLWGNPDKNIGHLIEEMAADFNNDIN